MIGALFLAAAFAAPLQPWSSGAVHLLRPLLARPSTSSAPLGSLMAPGWRLLWDGAPPTQGAMVVRLTLPVVPADGPGTAVEVLQIGAGSDARRCTTYGLRGGSGRRLPDRKIGGVRFVAWANGDAGMSQQIAATDLRAVIGGRCYAVARFSYATRAAERDAAVTLPQAKGAAMLDAALASLRIGSAPVKPARLHPPPHAVAR